MRGQGAIFAAQSSHHCTPPEVLDCVRRLGVIGLDPCSNARSEVGARVEWRRAGLDHEWLGYGLVYVNPPYGRDVQSWTRRCAETGDRGENVVGLLPVRSDSRWWHEDVARAAAICFWRGRLRFLGACSSAPFPSAVVFWGGGEFAHAARAAFGAVGWIP